VSTRNCCLLDLSMMKRRQVFVMQTCTAVEFGRASFPVGCRCRAGNNSAPGFRSGGGTSRKLLKGRVWTAIFWSGDSLDCRESFWSWSEGGFSQREEPPPGLRAGSSVAVSRGPAVLVAWSAAWCRVRGVAER
jgi:hypothetical protein